MSHNPYFNRWFSAIAIEFIAKRNGDGHNPYFNRWFSAIVEVLNMNLEEFKSQSLF